LKKNKNFPAVDSVIKETADFMTQDIEIELRPAPIDRGRKTKNFHIQKWLFLASTFYPLERLRPAFMPR